MWPRGVEERRARPGARAVAERDAPHAGSLDRELSTQSPAVAVARVRVDGPGPEVRHEQVAREASESLGSECDAPRLVELLLAADARHELPVEIELVDVTSGRRIVAVDGGAPRIRHEDAVGDGLDAERRVPDRDCRICERALPNERPPV